MVTLTRATFRLIADTINQSYTPDDPQKKYIAQQFADVLAKTNPRFNRDKFMGACGFVALKFPTASGKPVYGVPIAGK